MTLLPVWEQQRITIPPQDCWPLEDIGTWCWVPGCGERGENGFHHIVRRSFTGGPVDFICIDGLVFDNRCKLCFRHHNAITENRALIAYLTGEPWVWCTPLAPGAIGIFPHLTTTNPRTGTVYAIIDKLEQRRG